MQLAGWYASFSTDYVSDVTRAVAEQKTTVAAWQAAATIRFRELRGLCGATQAPIKRRTGRVVLAAV